MEEKIEILLFDEEKLSQTLLESYISDLTFPCNIRKYQEFNGDVIPEDDKLKIIIININKTNEIILEKAKEISHNKSNIIIFISYDKTADIQVRALRAGARDFLLKPVIKSDFINTLQRIYQKEYLAKEKTMNSKVYSTISVENGVGKTFFALNLSKKLADITKENVILIDFNNKLTDLFQILNIHTKHSTYNYINTITEYNAKELFSNLIKFEVPNLHLLGNGIFANYGIAVDITKIDLFFKILKQHYKYIIIDNDLSEKDINSKLILNSDYIYLITDSNLSSAEKIKHNKSLFNAEDRRTRVILNKYNKNKDEAVINEIEQVIGKKIFSKIPKNFLAASSAVDKSVTIDKVAPKLDIVKEYEKIAKYMVEKD